MEKVLNQPYSRMAIALLILINLVSDQISKLIARHFLIENEHIVVIKDRFILTRVENDGAFLSFGSEMPNFMKIILLNLLPVAVLLYGLWYIFRYQNLSRINQFGICCLLGGGIGNIFDRLMYGSVTDFFFLDFYLFRTGVFNVADMSIMLGIGLMAFEMWTKRNVTTKQLD